MKLFEWNVKFLNTNDFYFIFSIAAVVKAYGQPLKAACAMVRLRLYDALSLVPPQYYEGNLLNTKKKLNTIFKKYIIIII